MKFPGISIVIIGILVPIGVWGQTVSSYTTDLELRKDGSIFVQEYIVYDGVAGDSPIFVRRIPLRLPGKNLGDRQQLEVTDISARWNNSGQLVSTNINGRALEIRVGDELAVLEPGQQEIELSYVVLGALLHNKEASQIVWQAVSGQEYDAVEQFAASVHTPKEYTIESLSCYWESLLRNHVCNISPRLEGHNIAYYAHLGLGGGNPIVITTEFTQGLRGHVFLAGLEWWQWLMAVMVLCAGILLILLCVWTYKGRQSKASVKELVKRMESEPVRDSREE